MGIPSCRFPERTAEQFICTICLDVADDPVVTTCEHIFCRVCIDNKKISKCPTCQEGFKGPKWSELKGAFRRLYNSMVVRCLNTACDVTLCVDNYAQHDDTCPVTFEICKTCNLKTRRDIEDVKHSCSQTIKFNREMAAVNKELAAVSEQYAAVKKELAADKTEFKNDVDALKLLLKQERVRYENLIKKCDVKHSCTEPFKYDQEMAALKQKVDELQLSSKSERARYERLIISCMFFRNTLPDWSGNDLIQPLVEILSDRSNKNSRAPFNKIAAFVDDYLKRHPNAD